MESCPCLQVHTRVEDGEKNKWHKGHESHTRATKEAPRKRAEEQRAGAGSRGDHLRRPGGQADLGTAWAPLRHQIQMAHVLETAVSGALPTTALL